MLLRPINHLYLTSLLTNQGPTIRTLLPRITSNSYLSILHFDGNKIEFYRDGFIEGRNRKVQDYPELLK
jgi:hypothetical protein